MSGKNRHTRPSARRLMTEGKQVSPKEKEAIDNALKLAQEDMNRILETETANLSPKIVDQNRSSTEREV